MTIIELINKLKSTNSRTSKEQFISEYWLSGGREFFVGTQLAYNPLVSFGITKIPEVEGTDPDFVPTFGMKEFMVLTQNLITRRLTGNAAQNAVKEAALEADADMWNLFFRPVILKDLRCGITDTTVNKVLGDIAKEHSKKLKFDKKATIEEKVAITNEVDELIRELSEHKVPVFSCQLAKDGEDEANKSKIRGIKYLDYKLDGVRVLTIVNKREDGTVLVEQYTRNGKLNNNFPHLRKIFEEHADQLTESFVFDGEVASTSFSSLMTQVNRKENVDSKHTYYALFDALPLVEFLAGQSKLNQRDRHAQLIKIAPKTSTSAVYVLPKLLVNLDTPEGREKFKEFNKQAIAEKYEGIMVKDPEAFYTLKRTIAWMKIKPTISVSLAAKKFIEGTGKYVGKLGAILFEGEDEGKEISVSVGGGFSDAEREEIWLNQTSYLECIGEIVADCFSLEQGATVYALRFPRFKGWRGSVPGEKI